MLLAIDFGNTQVSFGIFSNDRKLVHHWRAETTASRTKDEYAALLFPLFQHHSIDPKSLTGVAVCSVVPPANENFKRFCLDYLGVKPFLVQHTSQLGFTLNVDLPQEVGADRLANAAYAVTHLKLPAIVVDLGTATTFDIVSEKKVYEGGIILPGVKMGTESLSRRTALLPDVDVRFPKSVIGKNTVACIQSGVLWGYTDAINGLLERLKKEVPGATIVLTGGVAPLFQEKLNVTAQILPNLTLEGTEILFRLNQAK